MRERKERGMAYLNLLASVDEDQVEALRKDPAVLLRPSLKGAVSHLMGYWVEVQPLGQLLTLAIDGGESVREDLWHPLRSPVFHPAPIVHRLYEDLVTAFEQGAVRGRVRIPGLG